MNTFNAYISYQIHLFYFQLLLPNRVRKVSISVPVDATSALEPELSFVSAANADIRTLPISIAAAITNVSNFFLLFSSLFSLLSFSLVVFVGAEHHIFSCSWGKQVTFSLIFYPSFFCRYVP